MRPLAALLGILLASGALAACTPSAPAIPDGVSVVVYQPRTDVALGRLAIQVVNATDTDLEVTAARLVSPDFTADVVWPGGGSTVHAGLKLDLRADLPTIACEGASDPHAELAVATPGGPATGELAITDPFGLLARLHSEQCVGQEITAIATLTPTELIVPGGQQPAILVIDVAPTGAGGSFTIDWVDGTTLVQPAIDGQAAQELPLGIEVSSAGPAELRVPFVPNRCDAHAIAEDKIGTIIPFYVTTEDADQVRWPFPMPIELRAAFYDFYESYCGFSD